MIQVIFKNKYNIYNIYKERIYISYILIPSTNTTMY